jgi:hypothetical protein
VCLLQAGSHGGYFPNSLETKIFEVLKGVRVELAAYHGGSLTGKDIQKVMNNLTYLFEKFSSMLMLQL